MRPADCQISVQLEPNRIDTAKIRSSIPSPPECGGEVTFSGIIRNHNEGRHVTHLEYEAYEILACKEIERIAAEAVTKFGVRVAHITHRTGALEIGDVAVYICVLAPHRGEAFAGCRHIIDELKIRAPIWKHEFYTDGSSAWTRCHHHAH